MDVGYVLWRWRKSGFWCFAASGVLWGVLGSGNYGLAQSTQIELEVVDANDYPILPSAVIYKAGEGDWQQLELPVIDAALGSSLSREETLKFTLPEGETRYNVAVACTEGVYPYSYALYALTTEVTSLRTPCLETAAALPTATVGGRIGYNPADNVTFDVQTQMGSNRVGNPSNGYSVAAAVGDARDLVVLAGTGGTLLGPGPEVQAGRIVHDLEVSEGYTDFDLLLGGEDAVTERMILVTPAVPDGFTSGLQVFFVSREGAVPSISLARTEYPVLPGAGEGDRYLGIGSAQAQDQQNTLMHLRLSETPVPFEFALPPPWPPYSLGPSPQPIFRDLTHLRDDPELRAYQIDVFKSTSHFRAVVSPAYLGDETSYALPDLTGFYGFDSSYLSESRAWRLSVILADQPLSVLLLSPTVIVGSSSRRLHDDRLRLADLPNLNLRISSVNSKPSSF